MKFIKELDLYQKGILVVLAVMLIVFSVVYGFAGSKDGFLYQDEFFEYSQEGGNDIYAGKLGKEACRFVVTPENVITFQYGDVIYGPYTVQEDPTAIPADHEYLTGVEIRKGDEILFRGGYHENGGAENNLVLIDENGDLAGINLYIDVAYGSYTYDSQGNVIEYGAPSEAVILRLWLEPELVSKGNWSAWFGGLLFSALTVVVMVFADDLFRLKFAFHIQNVEDAEPTDWEIAGRYIGWTALTVAVFALYFTGLHL